MASGVFAQKTLTWEDAKREFEAANPTLRAGRIGIQESRADEVTFGLRHATERFEPAAALQVETSATSGAGARNNFVFVPAWRGVLLDFLQAQQDYRSIQLSYLDLVGSYLNAASQMNLAVGREVIR